MLTTQQKIGRLNLSIKNIQDCIDNQEKEKKKLNADSIECLNIELSIINYKVNLKALKDWKEQLEENIKSKSSEYGTT